MRRHRKTLTYLLTVHTHYASVYQAAKLVAALLRVAGVTAGLVESNGSLPPGLWLTLPAGWLPRTGISSGTLLSVIEYGLHLPFFLLTYGAVCGSNRVGKSTSATINTIIAAVHSRAVLTNTILSFLFVSRKGYSLPLLRQNLNHVARTFS